jgi:ABC-type polysaccharide/polyol phosphate export permease
MFVHIVILGIVAIFMTLLGHPPSIYYLNFIYYWFTLIVFLTSLSFFFGCINLYTPDFGKFIKSISFPLFWATPVLYAPSEASEIYFKIFNPFYYFISGYRDTFIHKVWFWENMSFNFYIWIVILAIYLGGIVLYNNIRYRMADIV